MTTAVTVWITRTQPGADATAERVRSIGMTPLVAPLLEVVFEPGDGIDLAGIAVLAFTSANGVRAFAARSTDRTLPVFTVGRGTARAACNAGFAQVTAGDGDVLALARSIPHVGAVLHAGAAEPAADLVLALERRGILARGVVVYRTVPAALTAADFQPSNPDFVLLYSAKAARVFRNLGLTDPKPVCVSPAIASLLGAADTVTAAAPTEDAMIAALLEAAR